jgi:hypothetical protein
MDQLNTAKLRLAVALQSLGQHVEKKQVPMWWVCRRVDIIKSAPFKELVQLIDEYRAAGATACHAQWRLFRGWDDAAMAVVAKVAVLVCTADVAMKSFAGDVPYPANLLFKHCACKGLWDDEAQRLPLATVAAHAANVPSLGLSGDQGQRVTMASHTQLHAFSSGLTSQVMDQQTYWADQFLLRGERIAPPITSLAVWRLTRCKRFGEPLLSFVTELLPKLAGQLTVKKGHPRTDFFALYYSSGCGEWWSMLELLTHTWTSSCII